MESMKKEHANLQQQIDAATEVTNNLQTEMGKKQKDAHSQADGFSQGESLAGNVAADAHRLKAEIAAEMDVARMNGRGSRWALSATPRATGRRSAAAAVLVTNSVRMRPDT